MVATMMRPGLMRSILIRILLLFGTLRVMGQMRYPSFSCWVVNSDASTTA
jgi:hypothetical protein